MEVRSVKYFIRNYEQSTGDRLTDFRRHVNGVLGGGANEHATSYLGAGGQEQSTYRKSLDQRMKYLENKVPLWDIRMIQAEKNRLHLPQDRLLPNEKERGENLPRFKDYNEVKQFMFDHPKVQGTPLTSQRQQDQHSMSEEEEEEEEGGLPSTFDIPEAKVATIEDQPILDQFKPMEPEDVRPYTAMSPIGDEGSSGPSSSPEGSEGSEGSESVLLEDAQERQNAWDVVASLDAPSSKSSPDNLESKEERVMVRAVLQYLKRSENADKLKQFKYAMFLLLTTKSNTQAQKSVYQMFTDLVYSWFKSQLTKQRVVKMLALLVRMYTTNSNM